jgi:hypothetical protein
VDPLNVSQFLSAYNASLADVLELRASTLIGILEPRNDTIYGGELFWSLVNSGTRLTVRIPERYRDLSGRRVEVTGQPCRRTKKDRGEIEVILRVQSAIPLDPTPEDWIGPLLPIGEKRRSSWPAIERSIESRILAGDQPRVLMFFGTSSRVDKDVLAALGQHAPAYQIVPQRIPLTEPAAVATALSVQNADADLMVIVCGGGEGISALSDPQVIEAVAHHVHIPIVSAVGHEADRPRLQDLVYQAVSTPTAPGTWLAARAAGALHTRNTTASDHRQEQEVMQRQLTALAEELRAAKLEIAILEAALTPLKDPAETAAWAAAVKAREDNGVLGVIGRALGVIGRALGIR